MKDWAPIWAFISTLLALAVGWGLTQATSWLSLRQADKRMRSEVLYFLLELHHQLTGLQRIGQAGYAIVASIGQAVGQEMPLDFADQFAELYAPIARKMVGPLFTDRLTDLRQGYQVCLLKLAAVDPLNASLLRGQDEVVSYLDRILVAMENPEAQGLTMEAATPEQLAKFRHHFEKKLLDHTIKLLLQVMQELAKDIGGKTQKGLAATLAKRAKSDADVRQEMTDLIQEYQH
jgi:hypothetical protein